MKFITAILLSATLTLLPANVFAQPGRSVSVQVNTEKKLSNTGIRVKFLEMVEDSRCPRDTNCIWAGNAKIKVKVSKGGRTQVMELNTNMPNQDNKFAGYEFSVGKLTPEPRSNIRINRNGYVATIKLTPTK